MRNKFTLLLMFSASTPRGSALFGKNTWGIVHSFFLLEDEKKFNAIHKNLAQLPTKFEYRDVSEETKAKLGAGDMSWRFLEHLETKSIVAENIFEKQISSTFADFEILRTTALHAATIWNEEEIAKAVIWSGVDIDAQEINRGWTALHFAAFRNHMAIGVLLIEAGANWHKQCWCVVEGRLQFVTALKIAVDNNHGRFADMIWEKTGLIFTKPILTFNNRPKRIPNQSENILE